MTSGTATPYINNPEFQDALASFQNGDWDLGLSKLNTLVEQYPEITELRDLRQEMLVRSRVDDYEREEKTRAIFKKSLLWIGRIAAIAVVVFLAVNALNRYSSWLQDRWSNVQEVVIQEVQSLDTAVKYRDAQNYLVAGRPEDALTLLEEIQKQDPNFPGLADLQTDANTRIAIEDEYQVAISLKESGDYNGALAAFEELQNQHPGYKDVSIQIHEIENDLILNELFVQAEEAYADKNWDGAIMQFESLRAEAPKYKSEQVEERLIESYINAAKQILGYGTPSSDALIDADRYFREALVLRPLDQEILAVQDQAMAMFKERLFVSYLDKARETLNDNEDSLDALGVANSFFDLALEIKPNDRLIFFPEHEDTGN